MPKVNTLKRTLSRPVVIAFCALLVRLGYMAYNQYIGPPMPARIDVLGFEVGQVARSLAEGRGYGSPLGIETGPTAWFTPVYPLLLAAVFKVFGVLSAQSSLAIRVLDSLFSALTCVPLFYLGRRLAGESLGIASAWIWAFLHSAVFFPVVWVWDTSLAALAVATLLWATYRVAETTRTGAWIGYGALWAFVALINPSVLSLLPFLLLWGVWKATEVRAQRMRLAAATLLMLAAGLAPWQLRNGIVFGKPLMLRSNFGLELWLGNNPQVPDSWTWWLHPNDDAGERERFRRMGELPFMEEKQRLAVQFIREHPADFARFTFHRFVENWTGTWEPVADLAVTAGPYVMTIIGLNCAFSLLTFAGLLCASRAWGREALPLAATILVFPLVYYASHTSLRYRHPIDPAMALLTAFSILSAVRAFSSVGHWVRTRSASAHTLR